MNITVNLTPDIYRALKTYSQISGLPLSRIIRKALIVTLKIDKDPTHPYHRNFLAPHQK